MSTPSLTDDVCHSEDFFVSTDVQLLNWKWLNENVLTQPWGNTWTIDRFITAAACSLTFGVYQRKANDEHGAPLRPQMVGFARAVTDKATYSLICDVVIDPVFRGRGLAKFLMATMVSHPDIRTTVCLLRTANAHKLYSRFDFVSVSNTMRRIPQS